MPETIKQKEQIQETLFETPQGGVFLLKKKNLNDIVAHFQKKNQLKNKNRVKLWPY